MTLVSFPSSHCLSLSFKMLHNVSRGFAQLRGGGEGSKPTHAIEQNSELAEVILV